MHAPRPGPGPPNRVRAFCKGGPTAAGSWPGGGTAPDCELDPRARILELGPCPGGPNLGFFPPHSRTRPAVLVSGLQF